MLFDEIHCYTWFGLQFFVLEQYKMMRVENELPFLILYLSPHFILKKGSMLIYLV